MQLCKIVRDRDSFPYSIRLGLGCPPCCYMTQFTRATFKILGVSINLRTCNKGIHSFFCLPPFSLGSTSTNQVSPFISILTPCKDRPSQHVLGRTIKLKRAHAQHSVTYRDLVPVSRRIWSPRGFAPHPLFSRYIHL